jgi:hypothetical protein
MNPLDLWADFDWLYRRDTMIALRATWTIILSLFASLVPARVFRFLTKPPREMRWSPVDVWAGTVLAIV